MRTILRALLVWILAATLIGSILTLAVAHAAPGHRPLSTLQTATTLRVIATIRVGNEPTGVDVNPLTNRVYVANTNDNTVSVINVHNNKVIATIPTGKGPFGLAVNPLTNRVYVANTIDNTVSVINVHNNKVVATVMVGSGPVFVAVDPRTDRVYVTNENDATVSVIQD